MFGGWIKFKTLLILKGILSLGRAWVSRGDMAQHTDCGGSRRRPVVADAERVDECAPHDIRSARGGEPACSSSILVHTGVGELPEQHSRNRSLEGRMRTSSRRSPWAAWQLAAVTMAACASASGSLGGVDGCQPAFTDPAPALATLRGASGSRGLAIATPAQGSPFSAAARSVEPAVRAPSLLLVSIFFNRGFLYGQRPAPLPRGSRLTRSLGCRWVS